MKKLIIISLVIMFVAVAAHGGRDLFIGFNFSVCKICCKCDAVVLMLFL